MITDEQIRAKIEQLLKKGGTVCLLPPYVAGELRRETLNIGQIFINRETIGVDVNYEEIYLEYRSVKVSDLDKSLWDWMFELHMEYKSTVVSQFEKYLNE